MPTRISLMLFILLFTAIGTASAVASRPPECVTYGKAIEFREYQNRCDELAIKKAVANGVDEASYRAALQPGIDQRNTWITFYKTQDPNAIAQSCVYAFPKYDYTKDCK